MPFTVSSAYYKVQINDVERPERNHPIHDSAVTFTYMKKRFHVAVVFDGVSESKAKDKALVTVSRELEWDLEQFCRTSAPIQINDIAKWFIGCVANEKYKGMGATTISLLRFDSETGTIDGFTVGDSPAIIARRVVENDEEFIEAQILAELDCVVNYPGVITEQWRYDTPVKIAPFTASLPPNFEELYLVCMSDGFGKLSDADTLRYIDDDLQDRTVALNYPHFARVYLPPQVLEQFPSIKVGSDDAVSYLDVVDNSAVNEAIAALYPSLDEATRRQISMVDLDAMSLYEFFSDPERYAASIGETVDAILDRSHISLSWMLGGIYNDSKDESGLDEYLREYVKGEIFAVSMLEELLFADPTEGSTLQHRLKRFFTNLDPIGDDFSISLLAITKTD